MDDQGEWVERRDPKTGKKYYYNKRLRQTAWHKPTGSQEEAEAWTRKIDPNTGDVYFYNTITKIRSAVNPVPTNHTPSDETPEFQRTQQREKSRRLREFTRHEAHSQSPGSAHQVSAAAKRVSRMLPALHPQPLDDAAQSETTRSRRHVSIKLGMDQLHQIVKDQAPGEDQFEKLRAMRRPYQEPERGPEINLALLALENKEQAQEDVSRYTFEEFAKANFNTKKKMFGPRVNLGDLLKFSTIPLKRPLLKLSHTNIEKKALSASKKIFAFMEQPIVNPKVVYETLYSLLYIAMTDAPQELRDEIFCQVIKQIRENPRPESVFKGWQLLSLCCGAFPPSRSLEQTLRNYIDANMSNGLKGTAQMVLEAPIEENMLTVGDFAQYARLRLDKSVDVGPRAQIPASLEVECVMSRKPVTVSVYLINGSEIKMQVETWTTVGELRKQIGEYLSLKDVSIFALIECSEDSTEYVLPDEDRILDVIADWEHEKRSHKYPEFAPKQHFVFRIRLFVPIDKTDDRAVELAYYQAVYDVTDGKYPVSQEDCVQLVALQGQEKFGDYSEEAQDPFGTDEEFKQFLPPSVHNNLDATRKEVLNRYKELEGYDAVQAMIEYLDIVQDWPSYGCQIFPIRPLNNPDLPDECYIAINAKAIYIIDPPTKKF